MLLEGIDWRAPIYKDDPSPAGFAVGDRVTFDDGKSGLLVGVAAKINQRTASVVADDRPSWRVDFPLWRYVVEV